MKKYIFLITFIISISITAYCYSFWGLQTVAEISCISGNDANTVLLIHSNTTDGSVTFVDSSQAGNGGATHTATFVVNADIHHDTAQYKFGTSGVSIDGANDFLRMDDSADWAFGSGDFTIDFWVRFGGNGVANGGMFAQYVDVNNRNTIDWNAGNFRWLIKSAGTGIDVDCSTAVGWSLNTWYHIACVRNGNDFVLYRNGVSVATDTDANDMPDLAIQAFIGRYVADGLDGWIDELRVSKGIARWTTAFTPFKYPYCDY